MGWGTRREGAKLAQQRKLLVTEAGDVGDRLGPGQDRQKAKQEHFGQGIHDLARLPRIRQITKILKKNSRFSKDIAISRTTIHRTYPLASQRIPIDSALQPLVTHFFTRLPWGGTSLHWRYAPSGRTE
jgi:hypothetical protein